MPFPFSPHARGCGARCRRRSPGGRSPPLRRSSGARAGAWGRGFAGARSTLVEYALHAAALEAARDDQPLDLAGPLPDAVDSQLPQKSLGDVRALIAPAAEGLHASIGATPGGFTRKELR